MKKFLLLPVLFLFLASIFLRPVFAETVEELQKRINDLQSKITELQGQGKTLSSQIAVMDNQINLTELKIASTEQQITDLTLDIDTTTKKIGKLEGSLDNLTRILINRIKATYIIGSASSFQILLGSSDVSDFVERANYLRIAQAHDKRLIYDTVQAKNDYSNQKEIFQDKKKDVEQLKAELESYTAQLQQEKRDKDALLQITRNDEAKYQALLAQALAERKAIVATFSQAVSRLNSGEGDQIGQTGFVAVMGNSGAPVCSSGTHLHFTVLQNGSPIDPAQKLKNISVQWYNSPDGQFSFTGNWDWPISNPIITQGYGMTYWAKLGWYNGNIHDGIDMAGGSTISAPKSGKIIYGSTTCGSSALKYAAIKHDDDPSIITLYLHIQ